MILNFYFPETHTPCIALDVCSAALVSLIKAVRQQENCQSLSSRRGKKDEETLSSCAETN